MNLSMWQVAELAYPKICQAKKIFVFGTGGEYMLILKDNKIPRLLHESSLVDVMCQNKVTSQIEIGSKLYRDEDIIECNADCESNIILCTKYRRFSFCFSIPSKRYYNDSPSLFAIPDMYKVACGPNHIVIINNVGNTCFYRTYKDMLKMYRTVSSYEEKKNVGGLLEDAIVVDVACGYRFTVVVDIDGKVYAFGHNRSGQLGIGRMDRKSDMPVEVKVDDKIKTVACGWAHVLALSTSGSVYVWGGNSNGELGYVTEDKFSPTPRLLMKGASEISASYHSGISAAKVGPNVLVWGNVKGYLFPSPTKTIYDDINEAFMLLSTPAVTPNLTELRKPVTYTMKDKIKDCFDDQEISDVIFDVNNSFIHAKQDILKNRCSHFHNLFQNSTNFIDGKKLIKIEGYTLEVYKTFLMYLYTDEVEESKSIQAIADLWKLSVEYDERHLQYVCRRILIGEISVINVAGCYKIAKEIDDQELLEACVFFASSNWIVLY